MPQYEIKDTESPETHGSIMRVRARTPEDAVHTYLGLRNDTNADTNTQVEIMIEDRGTRFEALEGWLDVRVDGVATLRIRMYQRMKFRRA